MSTGRQRRRKLESLRRAGLDYLSKERVQTLEAAWRDGAVAPDVATGTLSPGSLDPAAPEKRAAAETAIAARRSQGPGESPAQNIGKEPTIPVVKPVAIPNGNKLEALKILATEVSACKRCPVLVQNRSRTVFSDGTPNAELCFVGEAPGYDEDQQGIPFIGKAGQLLTKIIEACKLKREEVYICNVLKRRPPDNRSPMPDEICNCRPFFEQQLAIVQPKMMVALGKYAAAALLGKRPEDVPITRLRGQIQQYCGIPFMITFHPAYLLRNPTAKRDVWDDMKTVMRQIGRPVD